VSTDKDSIFEVDGIKFIIHTELANYSKGFIVDYRGGVFGKRMIVQDMGHNGSTCG
jgi:Fe-S cluster assembly iron-binding protein IscA